MALEVDGGGLVLSALLVIVIVSLLTYIISHHPKHLTNNNMALQAVGGDTHVVNQDELDPNLVEKSNILSEEKENSIQYVKLLKNLEIQMLAINQLIDDAETTNHQKLKQWLDELKQVVFDAEDVRDVIAAQTHENEASSTTPWNPFGRSLHQELEDVLYRMKSLLEQKDVFALKPSARSNSSSETSIRLPTTSLVEKSAVLGRDDDQEKIKKLLLSNDGRSNGDVIAIVGMGGLGKTTLARIVFNHYEINSVFKSYKVWICVSEDFDVIKITRTILERLTSQSYDTNDLDLLQRKLHEILSGKKFLIVLDDVWNENYMNWDDLQRPFGFAAPGSKIIVTTRSEKVAFVMRATSTYKLKPLPEEDCWSLFAKHAFENIQSNAYSTFEAMGRELVKKCGGLPLAAKVLGGLLHTRLGCEEWNEVLKSHIWDLSNEASDNILLVLRLSYHYLPSKLKRCFAFCSLVPKDFDFGREKLVLLWMAENLLQGSKSKRKIDVGYEYLRDLESRSLIQPAIYHGESYFSMHDLVNDLAKSISGEFYTSFDLENSFNLGEKTRHLSYMRRDDDHEDPTPTRFKGVNEAKRLRTFLPLSFRYGRLPPLLHSEIWSQLNVLRSLTLTKAGIITLPDSIGNLKLLCYLDLSWNSDIIQLPESVASLHNLEVLNLGGCESLTKLPSKMRQLIKLNYLNISYIPSLEEMPLQMGRLKDLDVLTDFVVGKGCGSGIAELKDLKYIRGELRICGLQNITHPEDALTANLKEKSRLEKLCLTWEDINSDNSKDARIILENLRPPHVNLKELVIEGYNGTKLPDWSGHYYSFVNLVDVRVSHLKHCFDLSRFGQFPSLKTLTIQWCDSLVTLLVDTEISVEVPNGIHHHFGHFSALVELKIYGCPKLELPEQHHCFTSIEQFTLMDGSCASLRLFPLSLFPKLKKLCLKDVQSIEANNINLEYLETIWIHSCLNLEYLDAGKWCAPKMTELRLINCESLKVLPENLCNLFPSLESLHLHDCRNLEALPQSGLPSSLEFLVIFGCKKLIANRSSLGLQRLLSLSSFYISGKECDDLEYFPEEGLLPSSLSTLRIANVPNLTNLNGKSFQLLTSLKTLYLYDCPKLQCLPEQGLPASLSWLSISNCPLLESRCQREQGEDWSKIAHIPNIHVD